MKILIALFISLISLFSKDFDFKLKPIKVSENSYYFYGKEEYFSPKNGGDIANSSFIITKNSVILIDTGSSKQYGEQLKRSIAKITPKPIKYIINTHHHPDHFLGNSAFEKGDIFATKFTKEEIEKNGDLYITNLVNLVQEAMENTKNKAPNEVLNKKELVFDGYKLKILYLDGHTQSDVAIYDENSRILYSSDLVFNRRTLATPHANLQKWIKALEELKNIDYKTLVAGHGVASVGKTAIDENIAYLRFLDNTLKQSSIDGLDVFEILEKPIPKEFEKFSMFKEEFERSVINLYPLYEKEVLREVE